MITDLAAVGLCASIYDPASKWDHLWQGAESDGGIYAGIKDNAIVFRGSITAGDWKRDLDAFPSSPIDHPDFGQIHEGFWEGMETFFNEAAKFLQNRNIVVTGHSLGAARAWLFAGQLVAAGCPPARVVVCGSPRPGCRQLKDYIAHIPSVSYRNCDDPVTTVPLTLPDFPVVDMQNFTQLKEKPPFLDFDPMAPHSIDLYFTGTAKLFAEQGA